MKCGRSALDRQGRLGTKEIESAALLVSDVVEAAAVPVAGQIKGNVPDLYVSLKQGLAASVEIANKVSASVVAEIVWIRSQLAWKIHEREHVVLGLVHQGGKLRDLGSHRIGH